MNVYSGNGILLDISDEVNVKDYGAVGDGVADDTLAIQQCIDENPHAFIVFPGGTYNISEPIECYHHTGGTYLLFGGSTIKATAEMTYMFRFSDYVSGHSRGDFGAFGTFGGVLQANGLAEECIRSVDAWMLKLNSTYCLNFTVCGIRATGGGLHNYSNVKCDIEQTYEWSEGTTTGIIADQVDSFFTDVQIMSCHYAVKLGGGGHTFSGCYFLSRANYHLDPNVSWEGIGIYITNDTDSAALVTFNNCYFDSHIYTFYADGTKVWDVDVNDCRFYITHSSYFDKTLAYILGGTTNVNIRMRGAAVFSSPTCDVIMGRQSFTLSDNKNFVFEQNKPKNITINNIFNVVNLEQTGYTVSGINSGTSVLIGAISNANIKNGVYKLNVSYETNHAEFVIKNVDNVFSLVRMESDFTSDLFEIVIDQTPKSGTALEAVTYFPVYLKSKTNSLSGSFIAELRPVTFKPASCYLYNDTYRTGTFTIADAFTLSIVS